MICGIELNMKSEAPFFKDYGISCRFLLFSYQN